MSKALVVKISETRPIEGRDKIHVAVVHGYQVIVSKNVIEGTTGIFLEANTQVSEEFAEQNDLIRRKDPVSGLQINSGYFEPNRRVRAIKLAGMRSEGFFTPLDALAYTGFDVSTLKEGDVFDELNGHKICQKYYSPATLRAMNGGTKRTRRENRMFNEHVDTEPLRRHLKDIPKGALITLTEKIHGCVDGSTLIDTLERGRLTIKEIVDNRLPVHIKAFDTEKSILCYVPIDDFYMVPNDGEWFKIKLENGEELTITGNNPVWIPSENRYRRVDELTGEESLAFEDPKTRYYMSSYSADIHHSSHVPKRSTVPWYSSMWTWIVGTVRKPFVRKGRPSIMSETAQSS